MAMEHLTIKVRDLTDEDRLQMFNLMEKYYLGVKRGIFDKDLSEKEDVMLLCDTTKIKIVGFSTLTRLDLEVGGKSVKAVFSGDTIVEEQSRNNLGFAYEITSYFVETLERFPSHEAFWVLICKGWRTYRILPFLFRDFSPRFDKSVEPSHQQVMDEFGFKKYPNDYNDKTGLIVFSNETQRIRPDSSEALNPSRSDEHIEFFAKKNPNHLKGDELVCIAPIAKWNFTEAVEKLVSRQQRHMCQA